MAADEPPYLTVGTDVSAKYKGAFCEAKIKKVNRVVKCKVTFKNNLGSFMLTDDQIKGPLRIAADIEAKHPEKSQFLEAVINKLQDYSQYTVVFDDGDETTLRRTSLCLKSGRHFAESPTLDQFPLTNPEHFGTPVIGSGKYKRKRRSTMNSSLGYESSDDDSLPRKLKVIRGKEQDPDLGKVVCVDYGDRRKKDNWYPGLIVPHPAQSNIKLSKEEHLIRSFKDGKYYQVPKRDTREFTRESAQKVENNSLRTAVDKAILFLEKEELPPNWDKVLFLGLDLPSADEDSRDSDTDSSDDEPSEEKDRFVAQLYKFMDERGTPINKAPTVSNRDLNLYKLFKIMHKLGGYNKVINKNKWKAVYSKMGLPQSNVNGPNQIKFAYKRYLQSFEDFYRKLGCTMVTNSRSTRGRHRSDRNFIVTRTRDRDTASPKGKNPKDLKEKVLSEKKCEEKPKGSDKKESKSDEASKSEEKSKSPDKKKTEKPRAEEKDEKKKREEKPRLIRSQSLNKDKKDSSPKEEEKKDSKPEKARTREDARKEKNESPEKKGTRLSSKIESERKEREEALKEKKEKSPKEKEKKEDKQPKEIKDEKPKDKKDDKTVKDRKLPREKKVEEKVVKEKRENPPREKREERLVKEKRDSSKEPKDDKSVLKTKKDDVKIPSDDKSVVKKKIEKVVKEKKEEKIVRPKQEEKSVISDVSKKTVEIIAVKSVKEEKQPKNETEVKKEEETIKDKPKPKLRERREGTPFSDDGDDIIEISVSDEKDGLSQDGFEKRGPGFRLRGEEGDEPPNRGKRRSLKFDDRDEKEPFLILSESDDESFMNDPERVYNRDMKHNEIEIGDRVKVKYGRGRMQKVYEAKVLKIEMDGPDKRYYVHYAGWNMRYDEWVRKSYIVAIISSSKQKVDSNTKQNLLPSTSSSTSTKKIDRGRPPGISPSTKPSRKNSTSSTNSSLSCSRATRSDRKSLQSSPLSSGLEPRKRTRKKSGVTVGLTDTSQESESDGDDPMDLEDEEVGDAEDNCATQMDCCFKEELFSDDEEKEKMEDVKRGDITELEKAICVEETGDEIKDSFFGSLTTRNEIADKTSTVKEDDTKLFTIADISKNDTSLVVKVENENPELHAKADNVEKTFPPDEKLKLAIDNIDVKKEVHEAPIVTTPSKKYSDIIKPAKIIFPIVSSPEARVEKSSTFVPISSHPSPISYIKTDVIDLGPRSNPSVSLCPLNETKTTLSFAGLQGLIQKSAFEKCITPEKAIPKDIPSKIGYTGGVCGMPAINVAEKAEPDFKTSSDSHSRTKIRSIFGASGILSRKAESIKNDGKSTSKGIESIFSCIVKHTNTKDVCKDNMHEDSSRNPLNCVQDSEKLDNQNESSNKINPPEAKVILNMHSTVPLKQSISPAKFSCLNNDSAESKSNDKFDALVQGSSSFSQESKSKDIKSGIFSLSFPHSSPKEKFALEQPYNKLLSMSSENLCRIKPKPSETVDLSKTIPGIIERLKKDVVADLKITDSPPPQKEELNFDFLRGSQNVTKSLSRSDSSNSLRICEDLSDTNDSNTGSKDLVTGDKFNVSSIIKIPSLQDNAICGINDNIPSTNTEIMSSNSVSKLEDISVVEKKEDTKSSQQTSVITTTPVIPATNTIPGVSSENLSIVNDKLFVPDINVTFSSDDDVKIEKTDMEKQEVEKQIECASKIQLPLIVESSSEVVSSVINKSIEPLPVNNESDQLSSIPKDVADNKESLFDDLLKMKCSNSNFSQSGVIVRVPEEAKADSSSNDKEKDVFDIKNAGEYETLSSKVDCGQLSDSLDISTSNSNVPGVKEDSCNLLQNNELDSPIMSENKTSSNTNTNPDEDSALSLLTKKEGKRKKLGKKLGKKFASLESLENQDKDLKVKDGKSKSKKRLKLENDESDRSKDPDLKSKSKKIKKNKNKKRFAKHDDQFSEYMKKSELKDDEHKESSSDKSKRKEKRKNEKKFIKSGLKNEDGVELKGEISKKKKGKKNRDKLGGDKKEFSEKKTKKKRKMHLEDNQDTDSEKDSVPKMVDKKKKKDRKKIKAKDSMSSDDAAEKFFKEQSKDLSNTPSTSDVLLRRDSKSDDPIMSFLLCEEKVPASPVGIGNLADDTSGSSSIDGSRMQCEMERFPLPDVYPCIDNIESSDTLNKHSIDTSAVLDNTPPTTPSSTESLLSSSPSHERDAFSMNYPESTQSGRESGGESEIFRVNANRTVMRGSEEYRAATTLAFAVCKSVSEKPKEDSSHCFSKRQKCEVDDHSPTKRKKKSKRIRRSSESAKSPRHKSSLPRMHKVDSYCEDSSGASPATSSSPPYGNSSTLNFTRSSPHRLTCVSDGMSRYNFFVPLHDKDPEKRIAVLQEKMAELRKQYMALRAEVIAIDHKRRRARKKVRDAAGAGTTNPSVQSEDGQSGS